MGNDNQKSSGSSSSDPTRTGSGGVAGGQDQAREYAGRQTQGQGGRSDYETNYDQVNPAGSSGSTRARPDAAQAERVSGEPGAMSGPAKKGPVPTIGGDLDADPTPHRSSAANPQNDRESDRFGERDDGDPMARRNQQDERTNRGVDDDGIEKAFSRKQSAPRP